VCMDWILGTSIDIKVFELNWKGHKSCNTCTYDDNFVDPNKTMTKYLCEGEVGMLNVCFNFQVPCMIVQIR
jgi:hypothetical protein